MTTDYTKIGQPPPARRGNWFTRNSKWVVPIGCVLPLLLMIAGPVALVIFVVNSIKESGPYREAVLRAQKDQRVLNSLGSPVTPGWWVTGSVDSRADGGSVNFEVAVRGSKETGTLEAKSESTGGRWNYSLLRVRVDEGPDIDLIPTAAPSPAGSSGTTPRER